MLWMKSCWLIVAMLVLLSGSAVRPALRHDPVDRRDRERRQQV
jgi:hypothetical protein